MNSITEFFKVFIKLFPPLLIAMLGAGHSMTEIQSFNNDTIVLAFGFKYAPTLWTCLISLFLTITALSVALMIILNVGKSYKKNF